MKYSPSRIARLTSAALTDRCARSDRPGAGFPRRGATTPTYLLPQSRIGSSFPPSARVGSTARCSFEDPPLDAAPAGRAAQACRPSACAREVCDRRPVRPRPLSASTPPPTSRPPTRSSGQAYRNRASSPRPRNCSFAAIFASTRGLHHQRDRHVRVGQVHAVAADPVDVEPVTGVRLEPDVEAGLAVAVTAGQHIEDAPLVETTDSRPALLDQPTSSGLRRCRHRRTTAASSARRCRAASPRRPARPAACAVTGSHPCGPCRACALASSRCSACLARSSAHAASMSFRS